MNARPGLDLLLRLPRFTEQGAAAYLPGLERMRDLLAAIGDPHTAFDSVHVAGTNGKGSTCSFIASIASCLGMRVGLHTSPHLVDVTERMRVDGSPAPPEWLDDQVQRHWPVIQTIGPSFFEATTALSFLYFAEMEVDVAVVEVGMGGRLDATNVLLPRACAITHIGLDHMEHLGGTLRSIAREKAGIAKPGVPVVISPAPEDVIQAIRSVCAEKNAPIHDVGQEVVVRARDEQDPLSPSFSLRTPGGSYADLQIPLAGKHQRENAAVAVRVVELAFGSNVALPPAVRKGLATVTERTGLRGRMEVMQSEPLLIADVAHNPDGLLRVLRTVDEVLSRHDSRLFVVFAVMADKDVEGLARLLLSSASSVYCASVSAPRALDAESASGVLQAIGVNVHGKGSLRDGIVSTLARARPDDVVLVTGSHLLVGELLRLQRELAPPNSFGT